ncbi:MAG: hypothetical protein AAB389_01810 [Patescibacteria group bacterium]
MGDEKDMIDSSPTTPVEAEEARKKLKAEIVGKLFQQESVKISNALKTGGKRLFYVESSGGNDLLPEVEKAAALIAAHFERAGWEIQYGCSQRVIGYWLEFHLPGTRAKNRRILKSIGIAAAIVAAVIGAGMFWKWRAAKAEQFDALTEISTGSPPEFKVLDFVTGGEARYCKLLCSFWGDNGLRLDEEIGSAALEEAFDNLPPGVTESDVQKLIYYPHHGNRNESQWGFDQRVGRVACLTKGSQIYLCSPVSCSYSNDDAGVDYWLALVWTKAELVAEYSESKK